jgi:ribosomal protein L11 methyltransferase
VSARGARASPDAAWLVVRFDTDAEAAERWSDALLEAGALSVDLSDPQAGTPAEAPVYGEPGEPVATWPLARIDAMFDAAHDVDAALHEASFALDLPLPSAERRPLAARDWVRETQSQFAPIRIDRSLWIVPSWCEPVDPSAISLTLDPGLAFGTGSHPTTRLCLEWLLDAAVDGQRVLDYGCGSGILAIAAAKLGAARVDGVDVDPQAIRASADNARTNGVAARFCAPNELSAEAVDIVVSNILANPLILLAPALAARVRDGGRIALAGILVPQAPGVQDAYAPWFTLAPWREHDGWVLLAGMRRARE